LFELSSERMDRESARGSQMTVRTNHSSLGFAGEPVTPSTRASVTPARPALGGSLAGVGQLEFRPGRQSV